MAAASGRKPGQPTALAPHNVGVYAIAFLDIVQLPSELTEFRQPIQVQIHLEMSGILVQLSRIQRT